MEAVVEPTRGGMPRIEIHDPHKLDGWSRQLQRLLGSGGGRILKGLLWGVNWGGGGERSGATVGRVTGELEVGGQFTPFPSSPPSYIGVNGLCPLAYSLLAPVTNLYFAFVFFYCWFYLAFCIEKGKSSLINHNDKKLPNYFEVFYKVMLKLGYSISQNHFSFEEIHRSSLLWWRR